MTQKDKELLLKDLCARLPYGVKLLHIPSGETTMLEMINCDAIDGDIHDLIHNFRPYLRPMSSMTEEERKIYAKLLFADLGGVLEDYYKSLDYLNSIHVDYRGLIEKGLAIEVTEENNPYERVD